MGIFCHICNEETKYKTNAPFYQFHLKDDHRITIKDYYDRYIKTNEVEGICEICGNDTTFYGLARGYARYCSKSCIRKNPETYEKAKRTMLERYGVENVYQMEKTKESIKKTNLERYGVENPFQSEEIKEKMRETWREKYGVDWSSKSPIIREKIEKTNLNKYGVKAPLQNEEILQKSKKIHFDRYGNWAFVSEYGKAKARDRYQEKYGNEIINNSQTKEWKETFRKIYRERHYKTFLTLLKNKNIEYISSYDIYLTKSIGENLVYKCLSCGEIFSSSFTEVARINCSHCYHIYSSKYEKEISDFLMNQNVMFSNRRRFLLNGKLMESDLYIDSKRLGIEFHGLYWHSELCTEDDYHFKKFNHFKKLNIKLIQIFENEWVHKQEIVKSIILGKLGIFSESIDISECEVREISSNECKEFCDENYIFEYIQSKVQLGLFHRDELVNVMSFRSLKLETEVFYCSKLNIQVINGFSKLLKYFIENFKFEKLISYVDLRYDGGEEYLNNGFKVVNQTEPNYWYWKKEDYIFGISTKISKT